MNSLFKQAGYQEIITNEKIFLQIQKWALTNKDRNKKVKTYNGNRKTSINIMQWNLGSKHWFRKRDEIQLLVDEQSPYFVFITDANLFSDNPSHQMEIEGYTLIKAKTMEKLNYSRIVLLCKQGLQYSIEWLKVGTRGNKSLRIRGIYIKQDNTEETREQEQQEERWSKIIKQWRDTSTNGSCLTIEDMNLDYQRWQQPEQCLKTMVYMVKDDITTRGLCQVVRGPTRFWNNTVPSLLDQCWSNTPDIITNVRNMSRGQGTTIWLQLTTDSVVA